MTNKRPLGFDLTSVREVKRRIGSPAESDPSDQQLRQMGISREQWAKLLMRLHDREFTSEQERSKVITEAYWRVLADAEENAPVQVILFQGARRMKYNGKEEGGFEPVDDPPDSAVICVVVNSRIVWIRSVAPPD